MDDWCPRVWPEEPVPAEAAHCTDCGLHRHGSRMVWGEGRPLAPLMIILDNPGAREDAEGRAFVCGTRQTLQRAVHESGLQESDVYVTFILKRRPIRAYDKEQTRAICLRRHLLAQIEEKRPLRILCLGNAAVQAFFARDDADVKQMRQQWHAPRGIPTAVSYHPLAVRRRPNLWPNFLEDWRFLAASYIALQRRINERLST